MSETFSFNNTGDREAPGFKAAQADNLSSSETPGRLRGDEGAINPSEIAASVRRGASRVVRGAENLHRRIQDSGRMMDDEGSIKPGEVWDAARSAARDIRDSEAATKAKGVLTKMDTWLGDKYDEHSDKPGRALRATGRGIKAAPQKANEYVDKASRRNTPKLAGFTGVGPASEDVTVETFKSERLGKHERILDMPDLEIARNALALARVRQRSVFGVLRPGLAEQVEDAEKVYQDTVQDHIREFMSNIVAREGIAGLENPVNQLYIFQMLCQEKAARAEAETEAMATRKGGKVGRWLANHRGLRVGIGIAMMVGGTAATALGMTPAAAAIPAGMYMATRGNIERIQHRRDQSVERKYLERELRKIISHNNPSHDKLLDDFVKSVNQHADAKKDAGVLNFMQNAKHGSELPIELQINLINTYEQARRSGGNFEEWFEKNQQGNVAKVLGLVNEGRLQEEERRAQKRGRGNRWKIASAIGLPVIGVAAVAGTAAVGGNALIPLIAGTGGFSLAEYIMGKRRQAKK